ncbi:hypothetical protein RRG08_009619 [Elysia crispata]|uniref:Uncharacterized protein n=1 Tax=Elysia crispata TaxID=231223 RepID=A0AAE1CLR1_9GAST|nr:hypothetical protein RRG08_009619 [Elysia crispata]
MTGKTFLKSQAIHAGQEENADTHGGNHKLNGTTGTIMLVRGRSIVTMTLHVRLLDKPRDDNSVRLLDKPRDDNSVRLLDKPRDDNSVRLLDKPRDDNSVRLLDKPRDDNSVRLLDKPRDDNSVRLLDKPRDDNSVRLLNKPRVIVVKQFRTSDVKYCIVAVQSTEISKTSLVLRYYIVWEI